MALGTYVSPNQTASIYKLEQTSTEAEAHYEVRAPYVKPDFA